jgi:hypothetical protein
MKQVLIETQPFQLKPQSLTEGKTSSRGNLMVEGLLATAEEKNGNGRYYKKELWEREMQKYSQLVKENRALGELDHPDSTIINLKNVSHNITDYWWDGDKIFGKIEILPTPSGNILKALFESGITVGVSSRGMGSLKQMGETLEVQDDFDLLCWDFVSTPSNNGSFMQPTTLRESLEANTNLNEDKINKLITDLLCNMGGVCKI